MRFCPCVCMTIVIVFSNVHTGLSVTQGEWNRLTSRKKISISYTLLIIVITDWGRGNRVRQPCINTTYKSRNKLRPNYSDCG